MRSANIFLNQSFKSLSQVGSVWPSSGRLARRMVKGVKGPVVLELGPGTGIFTKEILKKLPPKGKLICIESNAAFAKYLRHEIKDKRFNLCVGDALMLKKFLAKNGIIKVDCVVSGLPLGNFKKDTRQRVLKEIEACLSDKGLFVQFEYLMAAIKDIKSIFSSVSISFELFNIPPAFVMRCQKK
jgi:phospholipid N-methyltransferase